MHACAQMSPIQMGLQDAHPYVRRTAVMGVLKVYHLDKAAVRNAGAHLFSRGRQSPCCRPLPSLQALMRRRKVPATVRRRMHAPG